MAEWVNSVGQVGVTAAERWSACKPFSSVVLGQNGDHPLHGSQDGPVDDHRPLLVVTVVAVEDGGVNFSDDFATWNFFVF